MISFPNIPQNLRIPGIYASFDPSRVNNATLQRKLLLISLKLPAGNAAQGEPVAITNVPQAEAAWGRGSMMARMADYMLRAHPTMALWGIALEDNEAGTPAQGSIAFTGAASASGTLVVTLGGESVRVAVTEGDTDTNIASSVVAAVNAQTDLPVSAAVDAVETSQVNITSRHKGEFDNGLSITASFNATLQPDTPTIAITAMAGGAGNPDIATAIAAMGDAWYHWIVCPFTDDTNLAQLETELADRYTPTRQMGGRAFIAFRGTYGESQAFGDARNSPHVTCLATGTDAPQPSYIWAAVNAVVAANSLVNDPAQQLTTLPLPNILSPEPGQRFSSAERNLLLHDGMSTYKVDAGGVVRIESQITMYQENAQGVVDDSMLYINVPETFERYRYEVIVLFAPHARDKLAADGGRLPLGQPIMTPKKATAMMISFYRRMVEELAWCEDVESYADSLLVEKDGNRLAIVDRPNFIENFRQLYMRSELVT